MIDSFNYLSLSIFNVDDMHLIVDAVHEIYKNEFEKGKMTILSMPFRLNEYFNPESGGSHFMKFSFWKCQHYCDKVFFVSNYQDGLMSLCKLLQNKIRCDMMMCTLSKDIDFPKYMFYTLRANNEERIIQVYKDNRWFFYERGKVLPFENISLYKNKLIRMRLNNQIIYQYLSKNGITIEDIDSNIISSISFERIKW